MATSTLPVDLELKKAFQELQVKMIETTQKLKMSDLQIEALRRSIQHSKLTDQEISSLPSGIRTFEGIGRMFILTNPKEVSNNLEKKMQSAEEKIKTLEASKNYLEKSLKESEDNLRDMIVSKQAK